MKNMANKKKVLVLSPHTDDAEYGCGGAVNRHILNGDEVKWITFVRNGYKVPDGWYEDTLARECECSVKLLGVKDHIILDFELRQLEYNLEDVAEFIYDTIQLFQPDVIYTPFGNCRHPDHNAIHKATVRTAWREKAIILGYMLPNDLARFDPNVFIALSEDDVKVKHEAIAAYKSQLVLRSWVNKELIDAQMRNYAVFAKAKWAEPFELIKMVI
jgi:LmbE family N-acetylglucosaminyl deacetylase